MYLYTIIIHTRQRHRSFTSQQYIFTSDSYQAILTPQIIHQHSRATIARLDVRSALLTPKLQTGHLYCDNTIYQINFLIPLTASTLLAVQAPKILLYS